jgi:hypothetical protein
MSSTASSIHAFATAEEPGDGTEHGRLRGNDTRRQSGQAALTCHGPAAPRNKRDLGLVVVGLWWSPLAAPFIRPTIRIATRTMTPSTNCPAASTGWHGRARPRQLQPRYHRYRPLHAGRPRRSRVRARDRRPGRRPAAPADAAWNLAMRFTDIVTLPDLLLIILLQVLAGRSFHLRS